MDHGLGKECSDGWAGLNSCCEMKQGKGEGQVWQTRDAGGEINEVFLVISTG